MTLRETNVFGAPVAGAYTQDSHVPFADPLLVPGSDRTITLAD